MEQLFCAVLFLPRLPSNVRMVLASTKETSLDALAELADKVMEVATPTAGMVKLSSQSMEVDTVTL